MKLVNGKLMAEIDRYTIEKVGIPGAVLMENAGRGAFLEFLKDFAPQKDDKFLIVCGKGNNGGDGFVIARYLKHFDFKNVKVVLLTNSDNLKGDAKLNYNIAKNFGVEITEITNEKDFTRFLEENKFDFIFDAILGTGLKSEVKDFYRSIIEKINNYTAVKVAVDIPSGLCSERGVPLGIAIKADATYTFGLKKIGLATCPGVLYTGNVKVIDISIPKEIPFEIKDYEITFEFARKLIKARPPHFHKGNFGHALILGGSVGFSGAVIMASKSALRSGCGLVTAVIPNQINDIFESACIEAMSYPVNLKKFYDLSELIEFINSKDAILMGPGLGRSSDAKNFLYELLLPRVNIPAVLDADALNIISENLNIFDKINVPKIITPHPGEFSRLTGISIEEIQSNRVELSKEFAKKHGCIVVLKGYRTVITDGEITYLCPKGDDTLATAGSGDVLGGIIVSLLAQGYSPLNSAILGVFIHGITGEICKKKYGAESTVSGDLIENLHMAFKILKDED